ncbi:GYD domain-containing protein [Cryobacterium cryoconiti]|uniref:GYD domain-containing protein n=1 Tax=Cryobacterium cryoconiti TaxID=1259239 RepID=A0A4Y8JV71_9MICO|nr:GYD domain-containing protein [Cryobacterium cryoconiti]TFD31214.1 GYD domain-containing protein [Cryobacterium cryoconiti]
MSRYLLEAKYVSDGTTGLMREGGTRRRKALVSALTSVGGSLESYYFALGETDVPGMIDVPEPSSAAALSHVINSAGSATRPTDLPARWRPAVLGRRHPFHSAQKPGTTTTSLQRGQR